MQGSGSLRGVLIPISTGWVERRDISGLELMLGNLRNRLSGLKITVRSMVQSSCAVDRWLNTKSMEAGTSLHLHSHSHFFAHGLSPR